MPGNTSAVYEYILMWFLQSFIFFSKYQVAIRHATDIELRIGGTAEVAAIEIKPVSVYLVY